MPDLPFPKKKRKKAKLTPAKVQTLFNAAIVRRDGSCIITGGRDSLQCSHFFAVGGSGALRFYPPNAHAMTASAHLHFHNRDVLPYVRFVESFVPELLWMERARKCTLKYTQDRLEHIAELCRADRMAELQEYIEGLLDISID